MDVFIGFAVGVITTVFLLSCLQAARKGDMQGRLVHMTPELRDRCCNMLYGAREMDARFYVAPYGQKDNAVDVTDVIVPALKSIVYVEED